MLQVYCTGVAKVDWDVEYTAMVIDISCKLLFPMFHLFFSKPMLYSMFNWMLHIFHTNITSVLSECYVCFSSVFLQVFQIHVLSISSAFRYMLQILHKCFKKWIRCCISISSLSVASPQCLLLLPTASGIHCLLPLFSMLVTFRSGAGHVWVHKTVRKQRGKRLLALASPMIIIYLKHVVLYFSCFFK